jgi:NADPH:quinone reductase-like Zn-dependent oxidoreductase
MVEAVGEGVKGVFKGDRVIAVPGWGGMVERLAVPAASVIKIPDGMDFQTAAALVMTYGTSYYALKDRAQLKAGESLLVLGAAAGSAWPPSNWARPWARMSSPPPRPTTRSSSPWRRAPTTA